MELARSTTLNATLDQAWEVLGHQFTTIYHWASAVNHAEGHGNGQQQAPCDERSCSTTMGQLREKLVTFDPINYRLSYTAFEGLPFLFREGTNHWSLTDLGNGNIKVQSHVVFVWRSPLFRLMQPLLKIKMSQFVNVLLDDFKHYVETGRPHARKLQLQQA